MKPVAGLTVAGLAYCLSLIGSSLFFSTATATHSDPMMLPRTMLWAWERPEDLRFASSGRQGVAFLARTIELRSQRPGSRQVRDEYQSSIWFAPDPREIGILLKPRLQPLQVANETPLMAVVRIETSNDLWHRTPETVKIGPSSSATVLYSDAQRREVAEMVAAATRLPHVRALQIDFDASQSELPFYAALLKDVRAKVPQGMPLSITALASWCAADSWLDQLSPGTIQEAVPMLFRMGPDGAEVASYLESGDEFRSRACRGSLGVSTDEAFSRAILSGSIGRDRSGWSSSRLYVFSPQSWTQREVNSVAKEVARWHRD